MDTDIRARFTPEVRAAVAEAAGVAPDALGKNLGFESFVHEVQRPEDGTVFVKSTWSERRTQGQIAAELAFVRHLADGGASVARPLALADGSELAAIPAQGGHFYVGVFANAIGKRLEKGEVTEEHLVAWGRLLGHMHRLARDPACAPWMAARPHWQTEYEEVRRFATDPRMAKRYDEQLRQLAALPTTPDVFGYCHTDPHDANVHWDGTTPMAFDFDDGQGFWYASDIAIVLYYTVNRHVPKEDWQAAYDRYLPLVRAGYEQEHTLPASAWATLPLFLDVRDSILWLVCERSISYDERSPAFTAWMDAIFARCVSGEHAFGLTFDRIGL